MNNFKVEQQSFKWENKQGLNETIIFMSKIHNNFLLASTNIGQINQITLGEKREKTVISKFIKNLRISCVLMTDCESLLISGYNDIDIPLTILQKKRRKKLCDYLI